MNRVEEERLAREVVGAIRKAGGGWIEASRSPPSDFQRQQDSASPRDLTGKFDRGGAVALNSRESRLRNSSDLLNLTSH
jgi:hypothetical protein